LNYAIAELIEIQIGIEDLIHHSYHYQRRFT